jgi:hypothetical protein
VSAAQSGVPLSLLLVALAALTMGAGGASLAATIAELRRVRP